MDILRVLLSSVANVVDLVFQIYIFIVVARAIVSWVSPDPYNPIVLFLHSATDPVLYRIRRIIPLSFGGIDFSPIVLLIGLMFVRDIVVALLRSIAFGA